MKIANILFNILQRKQFFFSLGSRGRGTSTGDMRKANNMSLCRATRRIRDILATQPCNQPLAHCSCNSSRPTTPATPHPSHPLSHLYLTVAEMRLTFVGAWPREEIQA